MPFADRPRHARLILLFAMLVALPQQALADIFVSSQSSNKVLRYDQTTGAYLGVFASGGGLNIPTGLAFGPNGNLYVCNYGGNGINQYDALTGTKVSTFGTDSSFPDSIAFAPNGDAYVGSLGQYNAASGQDASADATVQGAVKIYDGKTGAFKGNAVAPGSLGGFFQPEAIIFNPAGEFFVGHRTQDTIIKYDNTGKLVGTFVTAGLGGLSSPDGFAFGPTGDLFVSSYLNDKIIRYNGTTGALVGTFAQGGALDGPGGLQFGADGNLYVVSNVNNSVVRYNGTTGDFMDVVVASGSGGMSAPFALALSPASVPEPSSLVLASAFAASAAYTARRRKTAP